MKLLSKKNILITGGSRGIGRGIVSSLIEQGANVAFTYSSSASLANEIVKELNSSKNKCKAYQSDASILVECEKLVDDVLNDFGSIDVLINNASSFFKTDFLTHKDSDWKDLINSNLRGPFLLSKYFSEMLSKNNGSIINISDAMVNRGMKDYVIYSMAKAGLENLTKTLARELAPKIRVNAVAPGAILLPSDGSSQEDQLLKEIPLNRIGSERDISNAVFKLCEFSYMTGQILKIDGGRSLN